MLTWGAFNIIGANQRTRTEIAKVQREVAADGIDDTGKFDQRAIACGLDGAAVEAEAAAAGITDDLFRQDAAG
jgi:hypothetical protein